MRYNRDSDTYTEKQYRDYGWARANNIISASESEELRSYFADIKKRNYKYPQTKSGDYMIAIGKNGQKIAFMNGTITNPVISSVIEIYAEGMELDDIRRNIYESERRGLQQEASDLFKRYNAVDYATSKQSNIQGSKSDSRGNRLQRGRSSSSAESVKRKAIAYHFNDDGSQTVTYSDGTTELRMSRASQDSTDSAAQAGYPADGTKPQTKGRRAHSLQTKRRSALFL